jgi:hypothetical protein
MHVWPTSQSAARLQSRCWTSLQLGWHTEPNISTYVMQHIAPFEQSCASSQWKKT